MIIYCFQYWSKVDVQLRKVLEAERVKENLHLLSFGVSDDLAGDIDTVGLIKNIEAEVVGKPGVPDLFHWG